MIGVLLGRFEQKWDHDGLSSAIGMMLILGVQVLLTPFYALTMGKKGFVFRGKNYHYFCHWYNTTFDNERAVEVAIALNLLSEAKEKRVLEIGNVLSHYTNMKRDVLDKYEKGAGVIQQDVVNFTPSAKYDLIISISTLEHVGFDEEPKDPEKFAAAIKNVQSMLAPGGRLFFTIPIAYNPDAVTTLSENTLVENQYYFQRISKGKWEETTKECALSHAFNTPYTFANAIIICLDGEGDSGQS